ncbi:hypothetical protein Tco_0774642 [Tanacetum coccineum]|uniref:Tf2-1-like SH3-like domain-containing protein n=1 Tax=Tanacetum coccineum TaxID=301880 RepID=A0ABQ4ZRB2_9ASTR
MVDKTPRLAFHNFWKVNSQMALGDEFGYRVPEYQSFNTRWAKAGGGIFSTLENMLALLVLNSSRSARDRQKSYADLKRKPMEFQVGDRVMLKVGAVAYKLELPQELSRVNNTFHVSNLNKYYADEPLAVPLDGLHIDDKLHFVEELVEIMDREVK